MAYPLHSSVHPHPLSFQSPQNKVLMQRQYREKEMESFNALRGVIKELTGEELQTRHGILRKAIELLSDVSEIRIRQRAVKVVSPLHGVLPFTSTADATIAQAHSGYSAQPSPNCSQTWPTDPGFDAFYYTSQFGGQHDLVSDMEDSALVYAAHQEYNDRGWSNYPQG